jgi:hypothetical protein
VSFDAITLCVASQRVFIVVSVYFVIDSVRKLLVTPSYRSCYPRRDYGFWEYFINELLPSNEGIFIFATASRPAVGPTQPPIRWVPAAVKLKVKWAGREADHSLLIPTLRMHGAIPVLTHMSPWRGDLLNKGGASSPCRG